MSKAVILIIGVFGVMAVVAMMLGKSLVVIERVAAVSEVEGQVQLRSAGDDGFRPIGDARWVRSGDAIRTGPDSQVHLKWANGQEVTVGPETDSFEVVKCQLNRRSSEETALFRLDAGKVWVQVLNVLSGKSKFEIRTPTATAGVRGTRFMMQVDRAGVTTVEVFEGSVELASGGQVRPVRSGTSARVTDGTIAMEPLNRPEPSTSEAAGR